MSGINIARTLFENYQEESRKSSAALHHANNRIKELEKQVQDYQKIKSILENKIRLGSNSACEDAVRQKNLTIKHLELQLEKSLKQIEELECQLITQNSKQCPCCETNRLLGFTDKKSPKKCAKQCTNKKVGHRDYVDRQLMLERIIEHKDKRIAHLSKEIKRLTKVEKDLTNKTYRLSKLLPKSHLPSELLVDCLLKEIQSLENQVQYCNDTNIKIGSLSDKTNISNIFPGSLNSKENIPVGSKHISVDKMQQKMNTSLNDKSTSNLHSLFDDINELRYVFLKENEKFQHSLNIDHLRHSVFKVEWTEIINKLNDIAEAIQTILKVNSSFPDTDKDVILQLQNDLKDNLELSAVYKNENECLRKKVIDLTEKLLQLERGRIDSTDNPVRDKSASDRFTKPSAQSDFDKLREQLDLKKSELDTARMHIESQQNLILGLHDSLQKSNSGQSVNLPVRSAEQTDTPFHSSSKVPPATSLTTANSGSSFSGAQNLADQGFEVPSISSNDSSDSCAMHSCSNDKRVKSLEKKLNVSEKNIKSLENLVEHLQNQNAQLLGKNEQLYADLGKSKSEKTLLEKSKDIYSSLKLRLNDLSRECDELKDHNQELMEKNAHLEEENRNLEEKLQAYGTERESLKSSKMKLDEANKHNELLGGNLIELENEIMSLKEENTKLKSNERNEIVLNLQQKLTQKESEVDDLKNDLHALETQVLQMNKYRRHFRNELKKLCDSLMEESDANVSSAQSKAIYKAAILRSLEALLQLDIDDESVTDSSSSALEEIKNQYNIYLTEVKRITELLSIKNQHREELLREYITDDFGGVGASLSLEKSSSRSSSSATGVESPPIVPTASEVESTSVTLTSSNVQSIPVTSTASVVRLMPSSSAQFLPPNSPTFDTGSIPVIPKSSSVEQVGFSSENLRDANEELIQTEYNIAQNYDSSLPEMVKTPSTGMQAIPHVSSASDVGSIPVFPKSSSVEQVVFSSGNLNLVNETIANRIQSGSNIVQNDGSSLPEMVKNLHEDLKRQRNVTAFFVSKCVNLEQQLKGEQDFKCKYERDNAAHDEFIKEFKKQLKEKDHRIGRLEQQFLSLQTEKSNVEIGMEQQKNEIEWLVNENKQLFKKVTATETELCKSKEEKSRILNEVNLLRRELVNEKYAYAKVENEVKYLREHVAHCESSTSIR